MSGLIAAANQEESVPQRVAVTRLASDEDLREAEQAWARLRRAQPDGSLISAVDFYLANAGRVIRDGPAGEVLEQYLEQRRRRGNKHNTVEVAGAVIRKFLREAGVAKVSDFTRERTEKWVFDGAVGVRTRRDRRDQLHNWAQFLVKQRHLAQNFVADIDRPKVTYDGKVTTLTPEDVLRLLQAAARAPVGRKMTVGAMLPYFAVCALSGIRPDEAKRLGPDWAWFSRENAVITGFRAKTSNKARTVEISPELVEILEHCRTRGHAPSTFNRDAFDAIRGEAGVLEKWDNDILRHTYASHHYAVRRDMGWLEKNMGNSEDVLKRAYLDQTILSTVGAQLLAIKLVDILGSL